MDLENIENVSQMLISVANDYFGEKNWNMTISNVHLDFIEENSPDNFSAGAMAIVRVQVSDGAGREDLGYGAVKGMPSKGTAVLTARKKAVLDGLKGAIINFGGGLVKKVHEVFVSSYAKEASLRKPSLPSNHAVPVSTPVKTSNSILDSRKSNDTTPVSVAKPTVPSVLFAQAPSLSSPRMTEEELAKAERLRRQHQKQEEFKMRLRPQHQNQEEFKQNMLHQLQGCKSTKLSISAPAQRSACQGINKSIVTSALDADDDLLLSVQETEAVVQTAGSTNAPGGPRCLPVVSSPSQIRCVGTASRTPTSSVCKSSLKRSDGSTLVVNGTKRPRNNDS